MVLGGLIVAFLNAERSQNPALISLKGIPIIVPVVAALALFWTFILSRTRYGRHLYALGGNREAARRAGIRVDRIRISAFVICSSMAAIGGIILVSRSRGVYPDIGGSTILLYSVGAAVIGGTSLLGGKGRVLDAVIGGLLIAVIDNGMAPAGYQSSTKFVVTAGVLLAARRSTHCLAAAPRLPADGPDRGRPGGRDHPVGRSGVAQYGPDLRPASARS